MICDSKQENVWKCGTKGYIQTRDAVVVSKHSPVPAASTDLNHLEKVTASAG
jgi:hypothetical protein